MRWCATCSGAVSLYAPRVLLPPPQASPVQRTPPLMHQHRHNSAHDTRAALQGRPILRAIGSGHRQGAVAGWARRVPSARKTCCDACYVTFYDERQARIAKP